jgi:3-hydroxyisobutyrate dehydrogenase-like beta-hydroxyacid dehydrogenase
MIASGLDCILRQLLEVLVSATLHGFDAEVACRIDQAVLLGLAAPAVWVDDEERLLGPQPSDRLRRQVGASPAVEDDAGGDDSDDCGCDQDATNSLGFHRWRLWRDGRGSNRADRPGFGVPRVVGMQVGILHPGAMGAVLAGEAAVPVMWASDGRSAATVERAERHLLVDRVSLADLVAESEILISVCPPHAAVDVADQVKGLGFRGIYVDANAIAPETVQAIAAGFGRFVDGGIVGPPPTEPGLARMYLAGPDAAAVAALWDGSSLEARVLDGDIGSASALKVAYAGWTKGSTALLLAVRAYAEAHGLGDEIVAEWETSIPGLVERVEGTAGRIGNKAWRFEGEMSQIAAAMQSVGLPEGFHDAAREVYHRLSNLKDVEESSVEDVNELLLAEGRQ